MAKFSMNQIAGVIPAMLTPFDENEKLDLRRTEELTNFFCTKEIDGLYLTGSTGEGFLMTLEEREAFVETVIQTVAGRKPVIVHVGAISTAASERLARHAARVGADAVSSVPPIYWSFSDENIAGYYRDIVQASGIPMMVYNVALAGLVNYAMLLRLSRIDGVEGIKYTASSQYDYFRMKEELGPDFRIYSGSDEMALSGLCFGADGLIGSTYNVLSDRFARLYTQFQAGDLGGARLSQAQCNHLIFTITQSELYPALRILLKSEFNVDAGFCRRPFTRYTPSEEREIIERYRNAASSLSDLLPGSRG